MTNAEKFEETFGFKPDVNCLVLRCPEYSGEKACPYYEEDYGCHCEKWWKEAYKR